MSVQWTTREGVATVAVFCTVFLFAFCDRTPVRDKGAVPRTLESILAANRGEHDRTTQLVAIVLDPVKALDLKIEPALALKDENPDQIKSSYSLAKQLVVSDTRRITQLVQTVEQNNTYPAAAKVAALREFQDQVAANEKRIAAFDTSLKSELTKWYHNNLAKELAEVQQSPEERLQNDQKKIEQLLDDLKGQKGKVAAKQQ